MSRRSPVLVISSVNKANYERYPTGIVAYCEFPGRTHFTAGTPGCEAVADFALEWALSPTAGVLSAPARERS